MTDDRLYEFPESIPGQLAISTDEPTDPACHVCGVPHEFTMAELVEPDPDLPVACRKCETNTCGNCGRVGDIAVIGRFDIGYCPRCVKHA